MKSPLRKFRGFGLPLNNKERKDRRPPPAKLDELAYAGQVPEFFSVHDVARCRARMRAKIEGITRQLRFRRFFLSVYIHLFLQFLGTVGYGESFLSQ